MSRKRTKKKWILTKPNPNGKDEVKEVEVTTPPAENPATPPVAQTQPPAPVASAAVPGLPAPPTREQQMARMLFRDFFMDALKITEVYENDMVKIEPFLESDFDPNGVKEIKVYRVIPKSNPKVDVYISEDDIAVSLKGTPVKMKKDEVIYLATNILGYVKNAYKKAA